MRISILILFLMFSFTSISQNKPAYALFTSDGSPAVYADIVLRTQAADVVFFGELHNNFIAHWLQAELLRDMFAAHGSTLIIGAEMFESDNQLIMDEYISGIIPVHKFEDEMRLWENYKTDYKPLVEFAKEKKIPFICTNVPRRYAQIVGKTGFSALETLSKEAKKYIAPHPVKFDSTLTCYVEMIAAGAKHGGANIAKAQALKDATMAHFISESLKKDTKFIHINGAYHSDNEEGIIWYLHQTNSKLKILSVSTVVQKDIEHLDSEHKKKADFILVTPESLPGSY